MISCKSLPRPLDRTETFPRHYTHNHGFVRCLKAQNLAEKSFSHSTTMITTAINISLPLASTFSRFSFILIHVEMERFMFRHQNIIHHVFLFPRRRLSFSEAENLSPLTTLTCHHAKTNLHRARDCFLQFPLSAQSTVGDRFVPREKPRPDKNSRRFAAQS
jgi:hypothetical protein